MNKSIVKLGKLASIVAEILLICAHILNLGSEEFGSTIVPKTI